MPFAAVVSALLHLPAYVVVPAWAVVCFGLGFLRGASQVMPMTFRHFLAALEIGHVVHYTKRPDLKDYYRHLTCGRLQARECHLVAFTTDPFRFVDFLKGNVEEYLLDADATQRADDIDGRSKVTRFGSDSDS